MKTAGRKLRLKIRLIKRNIKAIKQTKKQARILTESLPCVNLYVKIYANAKLKIYNNDDLIAQLTADEASRLLELGAYFFCCVLYCLCIKNSIGKYY